MGHNKVRIEQLANHGDLLPIVAGWLYLEWWQDIEGATLSSVTEVLRAHLEPDKIPMTLVALLGTQPVGTTTLIAHDVGTDQWPHLSPWVAAVYVDPVHRRRGIGTALMAQTVARAKAMGINILYLLTTEREDFYAQLGWHVNARSEERVVMSHVG